MTLRTMYGGQPNTLFTVTGTGFGIPQLVGGQTYCFNVRNYSQDLHAISCTTKTCDMQLSVNAPN